MRKHTITTKKKGFTLIEFLVVVVIVTSLAAIMLPALQQAREQARRTQCKDNLKQFGLALHNYNESHRTFPPGVISRTSDTRQGLHSGLVFLLPMLGHEGIYNRYDFDLPWNSPGNLSATEINVEVFRCPNTGGVVPQTAGINVGSTDYAFSKGPGAQLCVRERPEGMFDVNSLVRINDVSDGLTNTFAIGEAASDHLLTAESTCRCRGMRMGQVWSKANFDGTDKMKHLGGHGSVLAVTGQGPDRITPLNKIPVDVSIDHPDEPGCGDDNDRVRGFNSLHIDGAYFLMADGAVRFVSDNINREMYRAMSTIGGAEVIDDY